MDHILQYSGKTTNLLQKKYIEENIWKLVLS